MGMNTNFMNQMVPNYNQQSNNHDVFDFSLHSSSMQQGTESASSVVPVSISSLTSVIFISNIRHSVNNRFSFHFPLFVNI